MERQRGLLHTLPGILMRNTDQYYKHSLIGEARPRRTRVCGASRKDERGYAGGFAKRRTRVYGASRKDERGYAGGSAKTNKGVQEVQRNGAELPQPMRGVSEGGLHMAPRIFCTYTDGPRRGASYTPCLGMASDTLRLGCLVGLGLVLLGGSRLYMHISLAWAFATGGLVPCRCWSAGGCTIYWCSDKEKAY
ncbi:hypothetical protein K505DRAFT_94916 [Melanomma pulvis-pyrius CBS 109.77]|uniref:Uncharacterized protein n=1 Tax=Melanomma pulvis-pyrius CBS 109.77 TaxID=1314802 RepID=A0A6A6X0I9_9PLEO|nr:hypothetical protein K505DRAFT_94916 [Melanomma pulvis-pyrius CBS 109.77]